MAPISCCRINFARSVTGVSGSTQSTPLCITSRTFMGGPPLVELIALYENAERGSPVHQLYNRPNSLVTTCRSRVSSCESRRGFPAKRGCAHFVQPIRRHAQRNADIANGCVAD